MKGKNPEISFIIYFNVIQAYTENMNKWYSSQVTSSNHSNRFLNYNNFTDYRICDE